MNKFNFHYEKGVLKTKSQSKRFFFYNEHSIEWSFAFSEREE